jgi:hypothetical protein
LQIAIADFKITGSKVMRKKLVCENIGGSPQFTVPAPELMNLVVELDPALWAATSAPCENLSTNRRFLLYLDPNNSGSIRIDEVIDAVKFLFAAFKSEKDLGRCVDSLAVSEINAEGEGGEDFLKFIKKTFGHKDDNEELMLVEVSDKINALSSGPLKGDGKLRAPAVEDAAALVLFNDVLTVSGQDSLTTEALDKFIADARDFLEWEENTAKPELKVHDPTLAYSVYSALKTKLDEFFNYCQLVAIDQANLSRFLLNSENMPPLEIKNQQVVSEYLDAMPLALPNDKMELRLTRDVNPRFQTQLKDFGTAFKISSLTLDKWQEIKKELAPYDEYCARIYGDPAGRLGRAKLENYLNGPEIKTLQNILAKDAKLSDTLEQLKRIEKMILFRRYLPEFMDNFVNFKDLYAPGRSSIIQAGSLILDGRHFDLTIFVRSHAEHKKYALKSNLCMIYVELENKDKGVPKHFAVASVTSGSAVNLYIGKKGVFLDNQGIYWDAVITDFVNGPVSFWQTMFLPFRKAGENISQRMAKLSSFNAIEQNVAKGVKAAETNSSKGHSLLSAGSIAVLCGSVGVAALGSGIAYAIKTLQSVSWIRIVLVLIGIIALVMAPAVVSALLKLRRRNLALFLEASGWAVNQHMRLKSRIAETFTYRPGKSKCSNNAWLYYILTALIIISALLTLNSIYKWF